MSSSNLTHLPIPDEIILEQASLRLAIARDHLSELQELGITAAWLDDLEGQINQAMTIPSFEEQRLKLKALTAAKIARLNACIQWGRKLRLRMTLIHGRRTPPGMQFPSKDWNQGEKNESKLIALWPTLLQLARTQAESLGAAGQTPADITMGEHLIQALTAALQAQEEYNLTRTGITAQRRAAYRQLYNAVNRINRSGQMLLGHTEKAKLFQCPWFSRKS